VPGEGSIHSMEGMEAASVLEPAHFMRRDAAYDVGAPLPMGEHSGNGKSDKKVTEETGKGLRKYPEGQRKRGPRR